MKTSGSFKPGNKASAGVHTPRTSKLTPELRTLSDSIRQIVLKYTNDKLKMTEELDHLWGNSQSSKTEFMKLAARLMPVAEDSMPLASLEIHILPPDDKSNLSFDLKEEESGEEEDGDREEETG